MERTEHHYDIFLNNKKKKVKPFALARATMTIFCFVMTHSFFHWMQFPRGTCSEMSTEETRVGFLERGALVQNVDFITWLYEFVFSDYICCVINKDFMINFLFLQHCADDKTSYSDPDSPFHKPLQTAANNSSFIIKWVFWIQLFYSCTYKKKKHIWLLMHRCCRFGT